MNNVEVMQATQSEWTWYRMKDVKRLMEHPDFDEHLQKWAQESLMCTHNRITSIYYKEKDQNYISGTLAINMNPDHWEDINILHYYIDANRMITIGDNKWLLHDMSYEEWDQYILGCDYPVDGFMFVVNAIIRAFFGRMDEIEMQLKEIEFKMKENNGGKLLREIVDLRNQMTRWNVQTVALKEIRFAIEEVFPALVKDAQTFHTLKVRLSRIQMLQTAYEHEIDTLLKIDDNVANYRSNNIMKTLTVFTVLLTPMTALGAIWGMNFKNMPELEWKWGYLASLILIFGLTAVTYWWLKRKGLTGDILDMNLEHHSKIKHKKNIPHSK